MSHALVHAPLEPARAAVAPAEPAPRAAPMTRDALLALQRGGGNQQAVRLLRASLARKHDPAVIAKIVKAAQDEVAGRKFEDYESALQAAVTAGLASLEGLDDDDRAEATRLVTTALAGRETTSALLDEIFSCGFWPQQPAEASLDVHAPKIDAIIKSARQDPSFARLADELDKMRHDDKPNRRLQMRVLRGLGNFVSTAGSERAAAVPATLTTVAAHRDPRFKDQLYQQLETLLKETWPERSFDDEEEEPLPADPQARARLRAIEDEPLAPVRIVRLSLSALYPGYADDADLRGFLGRRTDFKDATFAKVVVEALQLLANRAWDLPDLPKIVRGVFAGYGTATTDKATMRANLLALATLLNLGKAKMLTQLGENGKLQTLPEVVKGQLSQALGFDEKQVPDEGITRLEAKLRDINDLVIYASSLRQHPQADRLLADLRRWVAALMADEGNTRYADLRYEIGSGPQSDHLRDVLGIPEMHKAWTGGQEEPLTDSDGNKYTVRDTDNAADMLRLGTDIGTCQNISGGSFNQCLLGYLLDGKNRAIVIKRAGERNEPILARSVFRILRGATGRIVLFIEKPYYSNRIDERFARQAIVGMARARAQALSQFADVDLAKYRESEAEDKLHGGARSLGGPARFEYLDTGVGETGPIYTLEEEFTVQLGQYANKS